MSRRIVYVHPGEMIEFRFVPEDFGKTAAEWRDQTHPQSLLLCLKSSTLVEATDPAVTFEHWRSAAKAEGLGHLADAPSNNTPSPLSEG